MNSSFHFTLGWFAGLVAAAVMTLALVAWLGPAVPDCQEDEAWIAVDHRALDAVEDQHGVSRACRNVDQLLDSAVEVYIQNLPREIP